MQPSRVHTVHRLFVAVLPESVAAPGLDQILHVVIDDLAGRRCRSFLSEVLTPDRSARPGSAPQASAVSKAGHAARRLILGRALRSEHLGDQLLSEPLAFASLSSVAYATQEILLVLSLGGLAYLYLTPYLGAAVAYRPVLFAYPSGGPCAPTPRCVVWVFRRSRQLLAEGGGSSVRCRRRRIVASRDSPRKEDRCDRSGDEADPRGHDETDEKHDWLPPITLRWGRLPVVD